MHTKNTNTTNNTVIGFLGMLTIVFITLKLTKFIIWPWSYILAPLWIPLAIVLVIVIGYIIFMAYKDIRTSRKLAVKRRELEKRRKDTELNK